MQSLCKKITLIQENKGGEVSFYKYNNYQLHSKIISKEEKNEFWREIKF